MPEYYTALGTPSNKRTVVLDQPATLPPGRVRVTVVPLPATQSKAPFLVKLKAIHQTLHSTVGGCAS